LNSSLRSIEQQYRPVQKRRKADEEEMKSISERACRSTSIKTYFKLSFGRKCHMAHAFSVGSVSFVGREVLRPPQTNTGQNYPHDPRGRNILSLNLNIDKLELSSSNDYLDCIYHQ